MRSTTTRILCAVALASLVIFAACGDDDDDDDTGDSSATPTSEASLAGPQVQPAPAQALSAERLEATDGAVELSVQSALFVQNNVAVPVGESITIRVTNNDATPHSLRIAGLDGEWDTQDDAVTTPDSIEAAGGLGELTFAPPVPGFYTFRCDFHPTTMGGQIVAGDPGTPPPTPEGTPSPTPPSSASPGEASPSG